LARLGFLCPPLTGHLNPIGTLGRALARRGHTTIAFQIPEARRAIEAQGFEFHAFGEGRTDTGAIAAAVRELGNRTGFHAARFAVQSAAALARVTCECAPDVIRKARLDFLIVDQNEPAGASIAQYLDIPFATVALVPLNREPKVPPPFVGWPYDNRVTTTLLNLVAYAAFDRLVAPINRVLNDYRRAWNLHPIRRPDDTLSDLAQLCQLTEEFDFPRVKRPPALHYLGPFRDRRRPAVPFPFERLNDKPLVYASFGTLQNGSDTIFQVIAKACAELDVQLVISTGGRSIDGGVRFEGQPIVVTYAPQLELLERASACITHGGFNTVMESLQCGVPLVAVPVTNDQPAVGARIRRAQAGEVVPLHKFNATRVRSAVERVLTEPHYRNRVQHLKSSIERAGGVERAADIVEALLPFSQPTAERADQRRLHPDDPADVPSARFNAAESATRRPDGTEQRH
jgi:UDP:flavonoid glycosyltransferase YjiC (YdhE family)